MHNGLPRLTEPMVRENGALRIATWDEALDRAAAGLKAATDLKGGAGSRDLQLLEGHQRDELRRPEVHPSGAEEQQHRQLQQNLTRP